MEKDKDFTISEERTILVTPDYNDYKNGIDRSSDKNSNGDKK